jgi:signal transduction histidine kinase
VIEYPVLIGLAALGASMLVSGIGLLGVRRTRPAGALLAMGGIGWLAAGALDANGNEDAGTTALVASAVLLTPLAMTAYPALRWQHPVDFLALSTLLGAGVLATVFWGREGVLEGMSVAVGLVLVGHTWWRIERADRDDRWALVWMALAAGSAGLVSGLIMFAAGSDFGGLLAVALFTLVGPAMFVGATRPEVVDVRGLVVGAVVFAVVVIAYVSVFMTAVSFLHLLTGRDQPTGTLAIIGGVIALGVHPLRVVLRGVVDELLFGERPNPLDAAGRVAGRVTDDPVVALRAIREALVLPYAALRIDGTEVAKSGTEVTHTRALDLALGGDAVGSLVVGLRPGDLSLSRDDEHVLRLVAPLLAQAVQSRTLAAELQASREGTITALEEERRRLRRDLHDGLGPRLSGIAFTTDAARNTLRQDPEGADAMLRALRAETVTAIEEIRRLSYAMRPPALDELGLVPALRQQSATILVPDGTPLHTEFHTPDSLPGFPAAVEVAAFRIVIEALTNAARHSGSHTATVSLEVDGADLVVEVTDEGRSRSSWAAGVGLSSMRERAAELGGTLTAGGTAYGGKVRAVLPWRDR